jgi:hypothetical protein
MSDQVEVLLNRDNVRLSDLSFDLDELSRGHVVGDGSLDIIELFD